MNTTLFYYLNISIRVITILMGVFIVSNWLNLPTESNDSVQWIGWVMIAVGSVRLIMYLLKWKDFMKKNQDSVNEKHEENIPYSIRYYLVSLIHTFVDSLTIFRRSFLAKFSNHFGMRIIWPWYKECSCLFIQITVILRHV